MTVTVRHAQPRKSPATPRPPAPGRPGSTRAPSPGEARWPGGGAMPASGPGRSRAAREAPLPRRGATRPAPTRTPQEGIMPGDQPVTAPGEDADAAFGRLYAEQGPALLRLATALTDGDHGRAEDLVQETMLRAWTHRTSLDTQRRSPRAWLATVARRLAVDAHRGRRQHRRRGRPRRVRRSARCPAPGTGRGLLPRPVGRRNRAHPAHPARHGQVTHLLRAARATPRAGGRRCGGLPPRRRATARAAGRTRHRATPQPAGRGRQAQREGT